jgi:hypothetical protein
MRIKAALRNGSEYTLSLDPAGADAEDVFTELAAGRSQALRGWVPVESPDGADKTIIAGEEIVALHLIRDAD